MFISKIKKVQQVKIPVIEKENNILDEESINTPIRELKETRLQELDQDILEILEQYRY